MTNEVSRGHRWARATDNKVDRPSAGACALKQPATPFGQGGHLGIDFRTAASRRFLLSREASSTCANLLSSVRGSKFWRR